MSNVALEGFESRKVAIEKELRILANTDRAYGVVLRAFEIIKAYHINICGEVNKLDFCDQLEVIEVILGNRKSLVDPVSTLILALNNGYYFRELVNKCGEQLGYEEEMLSDIYEEIMFSDMKNLVMVFDKHFGEHINLMMSSQV